MRLAHLLKPYWAWFLLLTALTGLAAWVAAKPPALARRVIDDALPAGDGGLLARLALLMIGSFGLRELLRLSHEYTGALLGLRVTGRIRRMLWQRLLHAPLAFFTRTQRGEILILIAHRLSTVTGADRIIVLEGGRVAEEGSHAELMARSGRYRALYEHEPQRPAASPSRPPSPA